MDKVIKEKNFPVFYRHIGFHCSIFTVGGFCPQILEDFFLFHNFKKKPGTLYLRDFPLVRMSP